MQNQRLLKKKIDKTIELTDMRDGKPVIRYFVSYAHEDNDLKNRLLKPLKQNLTLAKDYHFEAWDDGEILAGEDWHEKIQEAVTRCDLGLLLISAAFLSSEYIKDHELPTFITNDSAKRAIPVALKCMPFDNNIDLKGLEQRQIFRGKAGKAFQEYRDETAREAFAWDLFQQILKIVKICSDQNDDKGLQYFVVSEREDNEVDKRFSIRTDRLHRTKNFDKARFVIFDLNKPPPDWIRYIVGLESKTLIFTDLDGHRGDQLNGKSIFDIVNSTYSYPTQICRTSKQLTSALAKAEGYLSQKGVERVSLQATIASEMSQE